MNHQRRMTNFSNAKFSIAKLALAIFLSFIFAATSEAKTFKNAYVNFELPEKWRCSLEQTEWVCRTNDPGLAEAIIVLTAKEVGPADGLAGYETHLKSPRTIITRTGQSVQSTVYSANRKKIMGHEWVDGWHFSSEVYNYYTRYLATIKERIAVLVTFSAHKAHYTKYSADFIRAIESLRVNSVAGVTNAGNGANGGVGGPYGANGGVGPLPGEPGYDEAMGMGEGGSGSSSAKNLFGLALIIGAVGAYLFFMKKKNSKKKKRRSSSDD
jgi:hypothetical protein